MNLKIPPLRERPADVMELAEHFVKKYAKANGVPLRADLGGGARQLIAQSLARQRRANSENTMHRAVLMADGDEIGAEAISGAGRRCGSSEQRAAPAVAHATLARRAR